MTTRPALALACLALSAACAAPVALGDAMRCGSRLAQEGDTRTEVRAKCGEPADVEVRTVLRPPIYWLHGKPVRLTGEFREIQVESWTYNLGPRRLMRRVRFENGRVVEIETLGYGYRDEAAARP